MIMNRINHAAGLAILSVIPNSDTFGTHILSSTPFVIHIIEQFKIQNKKTETLSSQLLINPTSKYPSHIAVSFGH